MGGTRQLFSMRRTVARQFVGNESPRRLALLLEKPVKEAGGGLRVPPRLYQDIQDLTVLIHGSIQIA